MERALKERIVGATVLVVVAVLVVPVFLDGPPSEAPMVQERIDLPGQQATDGVQTVVLDRDRSEPVPAPPAPASGVDERPGEQPAASEPGTTSDDTTAVAAASAESPADAAPADQAPSPVPQPAQASAPSPPEETAREGDTPPPAEPRPARSTTGMWAVQLGSFSNRANAERLAAELRQQGFGAFLSRLETSDAELHRVRVGPQKDRDSAEAMAARLERAGQKGQVVPHP